MSTYDHYATGTWLLSNTIANFSVVLRLWGRVDKYALWTGLGAVLLAFREDLVVRSFDDAHFAWLAGAWLASFAGVIFVGVRKHRRAEYAPVVAKDKTKAN